MAMGASQRASIDRRSATNRRPHHSHSRAFGSFLPPHPGHKIVSRRRSLFIMQAELYRFALAPPRGVTHLRAG
jgi:hypothetical protein